MKELLYNQHIVTIVLGLMLSVLASVALGERVGRRTGSGGESFRTHINTLQGSLLGLTALLLGFTFSMALSRYESRSTAVVEEANAMGTTYLRTRLLPPALGEAARVLLKEYADSRVAAGRIALHQGEARAAELARATGVLDRLWLVAAQAAESDGNPVRSGLFIQSLNEMIDSFGRREAALERHVPELVLLLLYTTLLITGVMMGYGCGVAGHRPAMATYGFSILMVLVVAVIIDIDRPRRGLIHVDQSSLTSLAKTIDLTAGPLDGAPPPTAQWAVTGRP